MTILTPNLNNTLSCLCIVFLLSTVLCVSAQETETETLFQEAIRQQNLGLAFLEESQPSKAIPTFTELIALLPDEAIGYGNLAVAHLRLQQADNAEEWVKKGIAVTPMESQLHFILSEVHLLKGQVDQAVEAMKEAVRLAPDNLEFRYRLVRHYIGQRNDPNAQKEALTHLQELHARTPVNIVILMKLSQALIRQAQYDAAEKICQQLNILLEDTDTDKLKYLTQGIDAIQKNDQKLASRNIQIFENVHRASPRYQQGIGELVTNIIGHPIEKFPSGLKSRLTAKQSIPIEVEFVDSSEQIGLTESQNQRSGHKQFSLVDYDNDGDMDIFSTRSPALLNNKDGAFVPDLHYQEIIQQFSLTPYASYFADLNKDGKYEILLHSTAGITVLKTTDDKSWDATPIIQHQKYGPIRNFLLPVDYDHDGDLDIFIQHVGIKMYRNNGDESFVDVSDQIFITTHADKDTQREIVIDDALAADFDDDGDIDIIAMHSNNGCILFDNLRQGKLRALYAETGIPQNERYTAMTIGDYDNDGDIDILLASQIGIHFYRNRGDGTFVVDKRSTQILERRPVNVTQLKSLDYDNDGFLDLWSITLNGLFLYRNDGTGRFTDESSTLDESLRRKEGISGAIADYDNDGDLDLFFNNRNGQIRTLQNNGGNKNNWIKIQLEGIATGNNKVNRNGIGSKLEVKVSDLYQVRYTSERVSHFGLGAHDIADVVRVVWTNGVPQNVIEPKAKQKILEKQVLKGSCPFLYVYDGEKYQFVTDLLWRAPLGLVTAMGFVAPDETKDFVKIPASQIKPKSGKYSIQITEELWETAYFDMVKLIAVDHPETTEIYVNEQYTPPPFSEFKIYKVFEKRHPKSATDHLGNDVSDALRTSDYRYAVEHHKGPYQGVVTPHSITLDLGDVSNDEQITLYLNGWIFPTDTSINVALSQNRSLIPSFPSLAVKNGAGDWITVKDMIGIPAGKNKTITVDLTGIFLSEDRQVRISTDMQIYWDAVFFTVGIQDVPIKITELNPDSADLHYRGFSEMYRPNEHAPHLFDYEKLTTTPQWRDLAGYYTRYGDVKSLLQKVDDMYVILNAGDEITVEFDASRLPPLKTGWKRDFILYSDGWDKDGDINTLTSQTVEPLPFHGMSSYPYPSNEHYPDSEEHQRYRLEYNTRRVTHKLPPLLRK